jgi:hypothetical protein
MLCRRIILQFWIDVRSIYESLSADPLGLLGPIDTLVRRMSTVLHFSVFHYQSPLFSHKTKPSYKHKCPSNKNMSPMPSAMIMSNMFNVMKDKKTINRLNSKQKQVEDDSTVTTEPTFVEKSVTFDSVVKVRSTITRRGYSMEEISMCWYSAEEYSHIKEECVKQIEKLNRGEKLNGKKYCTRGLEGHTEVRLCERMLAKELARSTVLNEQDDQVSEGVRDEDFMSKIYQNVSSSCKSWAHLVALCDERAVKKIIAQDFSIH